MCQQCRETVLGGKMEKPGDVRQVDVLGLAAAWVAGKELEGVGIDRQCGAAHGHKALADGEVTADVHLLFTGPIDF